MLWELQLRESSPIDVICNFLLIWLGFLFLDLILNLHVESTVLLLEFDFLLDSCGSVANLAAVQHMEDTGVGTELRKSSHF